MFRLFQFFSYHIHIHYLPSSAVSVMDRVKNRPNALLKHGLILHHDVLYSADLATVSKCFFNFLAKYCNLKCTPLELLKIIADQSVIGKDVLKCYGLS